jgi:hypothetical protein
MVEVFLGRKPGWKQARQLLPGGILAGWQSLVLTVPIR